MEFFYYLVKIAAITLQIVNEFHPSPERVLVVPGTHLTVPWIKVDQVGPSHDQGESGLITTARTGSVELREHRLEHRFHPLPRVARILRIERLPDAAASDPLGPMPPHRGRLGADPRPGAVDFDPLPGDHVATNDRVVETLEQHRQVRLVHRMPGVGRVEAELGVFWTIWIIGINRDRLQRRP